LSTTFTHDTCIGTWTFWKLKLDRKYEPLVVDVNLIDDHRDEELYYYNEQYFVAMYPRLSHIVEHTFLPHVRDVVPSEAGHENQISFDPTYSTSHTWWDYGRKWQVLKWRSSPFRRRTYALEDNINGRNPSRPSKSDAVRMACARS
jgi:hypothetical protein